MTGQVVWRADIFFPEFLLSGSAQCHARRKKNVLTVAARAVLVLIGFVRLVGEVQVSCIHSFVLCAQLRELEQRLHMPFSMAIFAKVFQKRVVFDQE